MESSEYERLLQKLFDPDTSAQKILDALLEDHAERFWEQFDTKLERLEQTLAVTYKVKEHAEFKKWAEVASIYNAAGFVTICSFDNVVACMGMVFNENQWKRRYYARQAALVMFEGCEDLPQVLGKSFREAARILKGHERLLSDMNPPLKKLRQFREEKQKLFKEIRIIAAAHRHLDVSEQLRVIKAIDWLEILQDSMKFDQILNELGPGLQAVMNAVSSQADQILS